LTTARDHNGGSGRDSGREIALPDVGTEQSPVFQAAAKTVFGWISILRNDPKFCEAMEVLKAHQTDFVLRDILDTLLPICMPRCSAEGGWCKEIFGGNLGIQDWQDMESP
jgi:hypothetical protein